MSGALEVIRRGPMEHGYYMVSSPGSTPNVYIVDGSGFRPIAAQSADAHAFDPGESLENGYLRVHGRTMTVERCLNPGEYHPRLFWPYDHWKGPRPVDASGWPPVDEDAMAGCLGQLSLLRERLEQVFRVVEPVGPSNLASSGHEIRSLLILACTEVESHWRSALLANSAVAAGDRLTTSAFVRLLEPMRLDEYEVSLPLYRGLGRVQPFQGWAAAAPTQSLDWYNAYNKVKHDREGEWAEGTLVRVANAVVACAVMVEAQFGPTEVWGETLGSFFRFEQRPNWRAAQVCYTRGGVAWTPVDHPF